MTELKPCPFCGGEAKFFAKAYLERGITRGWQFGIYCTKCNVTTPKTNYGLEIQLADWGNIITTVDERPLAIEAWNRRTHENR
jgi:Lar family restriction alleviation protein